MAANAPAVEEPQKRKFNFPTAYTILALLIIVFAALTFVIPAGKYDTDASGAPIPGTYHAVESAPQNLQAILLAPINGMYGIEDRQGYVNVYNTGALYGAIDVAMFILMIGGFLGITMKTGAIDAGITALVKRLGTNGKLLIPIMMIVFAAGGTSYGMAEESLAFYPLIIAALIALGYDAITGIAVVMLGAGIGVLGSTINPFATGVATGIAGIPLTEGIIYRLLILVGGLAVGIWYVMRYAAKVKADPSKSLVADRKQANEEHFLRGGAQAEAPEFTTQRKVILALFILAFIIMIIGVIPWSDLGINRIATRYWWFAELSALFLVFGIIIGLVARMKEGDLVSNFIAGAADMVGVALVVALARGITVIMNNGLIIDTVLYWCESLLAGLGGVAFINVIFLLYLPLSFLVPSSSGLATLTMPIMAPLASFAGV
ncbi:YfcC family protein, partial [Anaerolineae bacterium CFX7]|nr:YfcC family protein [Anaerolineae bacterium CFX7]